MNKVDSFPNYWFFSAHDMYDHCNSIEQGPVGKCVSIIVCEDSKNGLLRVKYGDNIKTFKCS